MRLPFTDHFIQDAIIFDLSSHPQKFSELLPDGMEHSQFMYHMRKLLRAGIVEKQDELYTLTQKGAQMYNARYQLKDPVRLHRVLIQFVVRDGDAMLLSRRRTHIGEQLNRAMLPGGAHFFMQSSRKSAAQIAKQRGLLCGDFLCSLETISRTNQYHGLIDIYEASVASELKTDNEYEPAWLPIHEVANQPFERVGSAGYIAKRILEGDLRARATYTMS